MPNLRFSVEGASATPNAASPQLSLKVRITNSDSEPIHSIALRAQVQIEPVRRRYTAVEQGHLQELFGEPERWSKTLRSLLWTNANFNVPAFNESIVIEVPIPCTFDFNVAVTKYIYGLDDGDLPTSLLFSGTVFYAGDTGLQVAQIPWDREANYRVPVRVWKEMMDFYYPRTAWICLQREIFERLNEFKAQRGLASWEQALERLLSETQEVKPTTSSLGRTLQSGEQSASEQMTGTHGNLRSMRPVGEKQ